ncbi:hypothetical protein CALCODRAFT_512376 [Calocera cornea HHB12733]|uniref:DEK C-terminal domain-containing protein n=1 Tax=Calocera cornea HHB12733 TaxID=1353952 RepID=A0A165D2M4_9BASI|nr:hypothetical protein CALCODRAFT_512376 [Calocera cornea HHB12733]
MSLDVKQLEQTAKSIVFKAKREDRLEEVTNKSVRRQVEQQLGLEEGVSDEYKKELKDAVNWALENDEPIPPPPPSVPKKKLSKDLKRKADSEDAQPVKKPRSSEGERPKAVKRKPRAARVESEEPEGSEELGELPVPSPKKPAPKPKEEKPATKPKEEKPSDPPKKVDDLSDTELSSVYDEPAPKRGRKSKASGAGEGAKQPKIKRGKKDVDAPASSTEEEVVRLKKFVTACGVRKVWSKEHSGLSPAEQVRHLRTLLSQLGMSGRMSIEKARKIRQQRELAQEIEDVVEYEKARGMSAPGRPTRKAAEEARRKVRLPSESDEEGSGGEEEGPKEEVVARQKKEHDLLAFIGKQSDDD